MYAPSVSGFSEGVFLLYNVLIVLYNCNKIELFTYNRYKPIKITHMSYTAKQRVVKSFIFGTPMFIVGLIIYNAIVHGAQLYLLF